LSNLAGTPRLTLVKQDISRPLPTKYHTTPAENLPTDW
jgi:hypothetical protein